MLRNTRIRTRLALMAFAPALTALVLAGITFALVPSIAIGGDAYQKIVVGKEFQSGTDSPSLYILDIHEQVQQLALTALVDASTEQEEASIAAARQTYEAAYKQWSEETQLSDPDARANLETSHRYAEQYFSLYEKQLLPAAHAGRGQDAVNILTTLMSPELDRHRIAVQAASDLVGRQVKAREDDVDSRVLQQQLGIIGVTLLLMAASIAVGITVLRSITDRVRRLNEVATVELPRVLEEVRRAAAAGEDIPSLPASEAEGSDELSAAAGAFNSVVATAVEMAAEQSRLRRATSQMFINLGRRNHKLLSRTLTYITQLESDERDPGTLQNLFRLDHLATRMRRHAESLLVLAGSPPLRTWSRPVPVADVLRAALSEIETYDRVDIKELEPVEVRGASVSDLAHLIAELLENATAFSPPQTRVRVLGRNDHDGYTIVVVDEGIGMSPEELSAANDLIASAERSGLLADSRMLGLGVVGRLASRHGFRVSLTASPVGGVVAWITLPMTALAPRRGGDPDALAGSEAGADVSALLAPQGPTAPPANGGRQIPAPAQPQLGPPPNGRPVPTNLAPGNLPLRRSGSPADPRGDAPDGPTLPQRPAPAPPAPARPVVPNRPPAPGGRPEVPPGPGGPRHDNRPSAPSGPFQVPAAPGVPDRDVPAPVGRSGPSGGSTQIPLPPLPDSAPVSGPIAFRKPTPKPGEGTGLTRRVRGAQLPDTGDAPPPRPGPAAPEALRPQRSAQSVRGALASFSAGRRSAAEVTIGNAAEMRRPEPRPDNGHLGQPTVDPITQPVISAATVAQPAKPGPTLPRRVRGAQMPQTDLPMSEPAPERSAAEVRAALSNFVAGRRAAEHED